MPSTNDFTSPAIIPRNQWGSTVESKAACMPPSVDYVFVHHTSMEWANTTDYDSCCRHMRGIQKFHVNDRAWDDIGYSFIIGGDGRIYEGRGWGKVGAHTYQYNSVGYGISLMGNFCKETAPEPMLIALKQIIAMGVEQGFIKPDYGLYGHMDARVTECPGQALYNTISQWENWHAKGVIPKYPAAS